MNINAIITIAMLSTIFILLLKQVASPGIIFSSVPVLAALCMGFTFQEVNSFITSGLQSVCATLYLMVVAVLYFGLLHEAGVFKKMVQLVLQFPKNNVLWTLLVTALISMLTQLDGSGATTALCTISVLKPVYEKQKIRREALLLVESLGSGIICILPWAPAIVELSAYMNVDVMEIFRFLIPVLVFGIILVFLACIPISIVEKKHGAGFTDEEFAEMKKTLHEKVECPFGEKVALFDAVFTLAIMLSLLTGIIPSNVAFSVGLTVLFLVHFKTDKNKQAAYFKTQAPIVLNLAFTMLGIGVLVGVNKGTGVISEIAQSLAESSVDGFLAHLPFLICVISLPLTITLSNTKNSIILPAVAALTAPLGFQPVQVAGCIFATGIMGANVSLFNASPYLALCLADVEMGAHLKYSLVPVYCFSLLLLLFMVVTGMIRI